ncbi:hypothetical protein C1X59_18160 [Pseudomonas sp. FW215-R2]|nr:hypothetical protein C1X59_18160 [Pseudomonas sp. FW215-R2]PMX09808.1 hypothetical protein C1X60_12710 [Pseudomonas sp. FW215-L1]PMX22934.1 hypothetical protein C1X57_13100 [Pseudomonas sp. FW215-E1]PNA29786.1 hypothetical protein C1X58_13415 [Pseudomonas sp. FW215-R4]
MAEAEFGECFGCCVVVLVKQVCCLIVPTLRVGMSPWTLRVRSLDAERPGLHAHAERGHDRISSVL